MPKPEKNAMALVDACRGPIRRQIMVLAEEAYAAEKPVTAKGLAKALNKPLSNVSYYVTELFKAGALEVVGGEQKRGAWQKSYAPTKAFQTTMTDTVALDQIAEKLDASVQKRTAFELGLIEIVRATGRPVEA